MRAVLYARVSTEEQVEGYSIEAQRRAFQALCQGRGWTACDEYIEAGKSAHTDSMSKRPVFKQAIEDAEAGRYDVLVVHKIDRFARKLRITLECVERLGKAGVGFVSIDNQMDYSTPAGKFTLAMLGGLAELYSDNLSQETKKGWHERRAQGLYCGLLPFGAMKGKDKVPVPDPGTYPGLKRAFELAAEGRTCRQVAEALNDAGYRTAGNQDRGLFSKDTVRGMLRNPFYIGLLRDGNGGHIVSKHKPFIDKSLWETAQLEIDRKRRQPVHCPSGATQSSLTGICRCFYCHGRIRTGCTHSGRKRLMCSNKIKRNGCESESAYLEVYEAQIEAFLEHFIIPDEYQGLILRTYQQQEAAADDIETKRRKLQGQAGRIRRLFVIGDITEREYMIEKAKVDTQLEGLSPHDCESTVLQGLADFLRDIPAAWRAARQDQRNALARQLFEEVWVEDDRVVALKPMPNLEPFFRLSLEQSQNSLKWRPRWGTASRIRQLRKLGLYPCWPEPAAPAPWPDLAEEAKTASLRDLAQKYGVSYETIRRRLAGVVE